MLSIFEKVWSMSVTASVVILFVLCARLLLKRSPKWISYALWSVVLFRLLCPFSIPSPVSLIPASVFYTKLPEVSFDIPASQQKQEIEQPDSEQVPFAPQDTPMVNLTPPDHVGITRPVGVTRPVQTVIPAQGESFRFPVEWVWLAGVALLAAVSVIRCVLLQRKLRFRVPVRENIFLADGIPTAFVIGLFRPKIYLPSMLPEEEWEYVLAHELCHIRRYDPMIRMLSFGAVCIHWFNPLVWLAFTLAGQDMEMSCDEAVVQQMGEGIRKDYSQSLLNLSAGRCFMFTPLAFGEGNTRKRIRNLGKWKEPVLWIVLIAILLCGLLAICLLTNPMRETLSDETQPDTEHNSTLPLPSTNVTIPDGEFAYPFYGVRVVHWADISVLEPGTSYSTEIEQFPGIKFHCDHASVYAEDLQTGQMEFLYSGMPIHNIYFADLTSDGFPELCSTVSFGSGAIDSHIIVYDYAGGKQFLLWDRMISDYYLSMVEGALWARETPYFDSAMTAYGPLTLLAQGDTMVPVILDKSEWHYEMEPSTSSMTGGYDGYLFVQIHERTYRYRCRNMDPQGLTPDAYLGTYYENTLHSMDTPSTYRVFSTKEYADHTVLLVEVDGLFWMSYYYAPAQRISESTWDRIRNTERIAVLENGTVTSGKEYFLSFAEKTWAGEACTIQTASYHTLDPDRMVDQLYQTVVEDYPCLYLHTLSYDGKYYTVTWEENGEVIARQYRYLMRYAGEPVREDAGYSMYIRYVLTNDNTVTWDDIFSGMISSVYGAYIDHYTVYTDYIP